MRNKFRYLIAVTGATIVGTTIIACGGGSSTTAAAVDPGPDVSYFVSSSIGDTGLVNVSNKNGLVSAAALSSTAKLGCATPSSPCAKMQNTPAVKNADGSITPQSQVNTFNNLGPNTSGQQLVNSVFKYGQHLDAEGQKAAANAVSNMAGITGGDVQQAAKTAGEAYATGAKFVQALFSPGMVAPNKVAMAKAKAPADAPIQDESDIATGLMGIPFPGVTLQNVPAIGGTTPITKLSSIVGIYNYIALRCNNQSLGNPSEPAAGCKTFLGTVQVLNNSTFKLCDGGNLASRTPVCSLTANGTVALSTGEDKSWIFQATSPKLGSNTNRFTAFKSAGQVIASIDFDDNNVFGYGQAVAAAQKSIATNAITGTYKASSNYGSTTGLTVSRQSIWTANVQIGRDGQQYIAYPNAPWAGLTTVVGGSDGNGHAIVAGDGIYVYTNFNIADKPAFYEIGQRVPTPSLFGLMGMLF